MPLILTYRAAATVPVELEGITPDRLAGLSRAEIERLEIQRGNRRVPLAELFDVAGDAAEEQLVLEGDLSGVHWIGAGMAAGRIDVCSSAGRHLGSQMSGGSIHVAGDAGDFAGAELRGGLIHIRGSAGDKLGAAYAGSRRGMTEGTILVVGSAGQDTGHALRRGLIAVGGDCGPAAGRGMLAGTILVLGDCGPRCGAGMRRGTLALLGPKQPELPPTFVRACRTAPCFARLLAARLGALGWTAAPEALAGPLDLWRGDLIETGRGEVLVRPR
jgi:formylmethanofuran dehydrogenase subunit C